MKLLMIHRKVWHNGSFYFTCGIGKYQTIVSHGSASRIGKYEIFGNETVNLKHYQAEKN